VKIHYKKAWVRAPEKNQMMRHEPQTKRQKKEPAVRREALLAKARLHAALLSIYLQESDDLVLSRGCSSGYLHHKAAYASVVDELGPECENGEFVLGYMAQGHVKGWAKDGSDEYSHQNQEAAFVRTNWIWAHLLFRGKGEDDGPQIKEGVALVERAAETMTWVSEQLQARAQGLAALLGVEPEAEAKLGVEVGAEVSYTSRLPFVFQEGYRQKSKHMLSQEEKSEARLAFEGAVGEVFCFRVCNSGPHWIDISDAVVSSTGLQGKTYSKMSEKERKASGSVKMNELIEDLLADDSARVERAINGALVASRGLLAAARLLEEACARFKALLECE
jgi:hypothetical protein